MNNQLCIKCHVLAILPIFWSELHSSFFTATIKFNPLIVHVEVMFVNNNTRISNKLYIGMTKQISTSFYKYSDKYKPNEMKT